MTLELSFNLIFLFKEVSLIPLKLCYVLLFWVGFVWLLLCCCFFNLR